MGSYGQNEKPNFDQKISLFQPSNLSKALILEPKGPQPPYSDTRGPGTATPALIKVDEIRTKLTKN